MSGQRAPFLTAGNNEPLERGAIPRLGVDELGSAVVDAVARGLRVAAYFADSEREDQVTLYAVLADDMTAALHLASAAAPARSFPSLTPRCPQVHLFEREIAEQFGLEPLGHPWLKPVRFHTAHSGRPQPWAAADGGPPTIGVTDYFRVEGEEVHEVAVGPVHAGVIEPGHFRFQCHGEDVFHLEIALGYQHRGIERRLAGGPDRRSVHYAETLAGDTTIGHATAYCHAVEALAGVHTPPRAAAIAAIALELERLANHVGDLGALANDVGFLPTAAYCGRIRGDYLNMTAMLCGNRFGRDLVRPGGVLFDLDAALVRALIERLAQAERDTASAVNLLWDSSSVMARFEDTGALPRALADSIGLVGPAARACGIRRDVRHDFPSGAYRFSLAPVYTWDTGDVFARAYVRWLEVQHSIRFIGEQLRDLPQGPVMVGPADLAPDRLVVSLVEGWRGEICHVAITDGRGAFRRYKVVDPSFHNWFGLALAMRDQQISDFPLCNKSFNLSYSGHDL
jgi:Ni,Fe-hydrogenase III large subunit